MTLCKSQDHPDLWEDNDAFDAEFSISNKKIKHKATQRSSRSIDLGQGFPEQSTHA
jgi:hypothetical protein